MRLLLLSLLGVFLLCPGTAMAQTDPNFPASSEPLPAGTLNSREVFALFNDKTVLSVTAVQRRESVSYYAISGVVRQLRNNVLRTGRWRVTDFGRICLQMEDLPEKCRIIVKENGIYKKYIVSKSGPHQHSVSYTKFLISNPFGI